MMYLITLVFGGWLIAHGKMEAADLAMYALYIGIFISPIQILVELTEMMQKGLSGFRRFLDVVETEPEIVNAPDAEPLENVKGEVEYKNVSFHYSDDDTPVLDRYLLRSRLADPLPLWDRREVERRRSVPCFQDFMM